eukprot:RCo017686
MTAVPRRSLDGPVPSPAMTPQGDDLRVVTLLDIVPRSESVTPLQRLRGLRRVAAAAGWAVMVVCWLLGGSVCLSLIFHSGSVLSSTWPIFGLSVGGFVVWVAAVMGFDYVALGGGLTLQEAVKYFFVGCCGMALLIGGQTAITFVVAAAAPGGLGCDCDPDTWHRRLRISLFVAVVVLPVYETLGWWLLSLVIPMKPPHHKSALAKLCVGVLGLLTAASGTVCFLVDDTFVADHWGYMIALVPLQVKCGALMTWLMALRRQYTSSPDLVSPLVAIVARAWMYWATFDRYVTYGWRCILCLSPSAVLLVVIMVVPAYILLYWLICKPMKRIRESTSSGGGPLPSSPPAVEG